MALSEFCLCIAAGALSNLQILEMTIGLNRENQDNLYTIKLSSFLPFNFEQENKMLLNFLVHFQT